MIQSNAVSINKEKISLSHTISSKRLYKGKILTCSKG